MPSANSKTGLVMLAAGSSERLGQPKQLLKIGGQTLLERMADVALSTSCSPVIVVLGAHFEKMTPLLEGKQIEIVRNLDPKSGIGSSISCGMEYLIHRHSEVQSVILMLCDQPLADAKHINELIVERETGDKTIIASAYAGTYGPPALFDKIHFHELKNLKGDYGAKAIMKKHADRMHLLPFPLGAVDIDNEEDWQKFSLRSKPRRSTRYH